MRKIILSLILTTFLLIPALSAHAEVKLGVLAHRGELKAKDKWTIFSQYLGEQLGEDVTLVPLAIAKNLEAAGNKEVDFILTNPVLSAAIHENYKTKLLATLNKKAGSQFGGVIIASKKSGVTTAEGLKGKKLLTFKIGASAGAYVFQTYHMKEKGIDVHKDFSFFKEGKKQDDIALAVKSGAIDGGFIRTGILEALEKAGKIKIDDITIIDRANDDFPLIHSTKLYPEWVLMALNHVDEAKAEKVKAIALGMTPDLPASQKAGIKGFVEPLSLAELTAVLKDLKIPPFDK